ncbi:MAG: hypothetical protein A3I66_20750 [Burkholderiales bacterium RIFCSPLOWO2_02_FULL_57_36]|nr:MAG: hypothetical protein A3I66_20750 [Burkholderiales bacterium RIFCSPLOWO2_02_FULL_57_36]
MLHEEAIRIAESTKNKHGTTPAAWLGRWTNQIGSTMDLEINGSDVSGLYTSSTSGIGHGGEIKGQLKGYVADDLISFTVLWPGGSITAWTGQLVGDDVAPTIKTLWHLVTDIPDADEPTRLWTSTLAGADDFKR